MTILLFNALVLAYGVYRFRRYDDGLSFACVTAGGGVLLIAFVFLAVAHVQAPAQIASVEATRATYSAARGNGTDPLERAALINRAAEINGDIAAYRAYNETLLDIWVPDALTRLEPIR